MSKRAARPLDLGFDNDPNQAPSLSRLFAVSTAKESEMQRATMVELDRLADNPFQPRLDMEEQSLEELAHVIKLQGFQGVLVARAAPEREGYYQLTAGHRRREAARRAGLRVLPVVVQELSDEEMVVRAITENIQREDLSPLEEGRIYLLMSEEMGYTYQQIAKEVGKTVSYVRNRLGVARAPEDVQNLVQRKPDTLRAVIYLNKVEDARARTEIIEQILGGSLTTDDLPAYIEALRLEVLEGPAEPEHVQLTALGTPGSAVVDEEASAEAIPVIISTPKEAEPINVQDSASSTDQSIVEVAPDASAIRIVQIDGVSTIVEHNPNSLAERSIQDEERTRLRVRGSKLTSALRTLVTYENLLSSGPGLSADEVGRLTRIATLVESILAGSQNDVQNKGAEK
jgi:ParB/RepB/Spo0J family partition protein